MSAGQTRKWVVFDDDPTGTQTVSGVDVILQPGREAFRRFAESGRTAIYVLTNSRALPQEEAVKLLNELRAMMDLEAEAAGCRIGYVLRGDSTLRGHVFAEMDALGGGNSPGLFVPAFPECGRMTIDGIHYLEQDGVRTPVADTEFANDPVFGYKGRTMRDWVEEKGPGWRASVVPLAALRHNGAAAVRDALLEAGPRTVVIPDAETVADIRVIADGLAEAEAAGREFAVRSASTFAAIRCGLEALALTGPPGAAPERLLVVCGSHTAASTRQLALLTERTGVLPVSVPTARIFSEGTEAVVPELAALLRRQLDAGGLALLTSERVRGREHGGLEDGAKVMHALTETVKAVAPYCDAVVSKGGNTSAQVAADGLQADEAEVCGQLEAGISLWNLRLPEGKRLWYAVIPGNVGDDGTMVRVTGRMKSSI